MCLIFTWVSFSDCNLFCDLLGWKHYRNFFFIKDEAEYLDYYGIPKEIKAEGMLATCIQHEMDHLEGILFIDYLSKLKKSMIVKKLSKQKKTLERIVV